MVVRLNNIPEAKTKLLQDTDSDWDEEEIPWNLQSFMSYFNPHTMKSLSIAINLYP